MKYNFTKIGQDTYKLTYTNTDGEVKEKEFTRNNKHRKMLDSIAVKTTMRTTKYLADEGLTHDDLVIKKTDEKGHITYDERNYLEIKNQVQVIVTYEVVDEICIDCLGVNIAVLFTEMGLDINSTKKEDADKSYKFINEFLRIIQGIDTKEPFPSEAIK